MVPSHAARAGDCELGLSRLAAYYYFDWFPDEGFKLYVDPETDQTSGECTPPYYPLQVNSVGFYLYFFADCLEVVGKTLCLEVDVECPKNIGTNYPDKCNGPGPAIRTEMWCHTFTAEEWSLRAVYYGVPFTSPCCLAEPFFFGIKQISWDGTPGLAPCPLSEQYQVPNQDCRVWERFGLVSGDVQYAVCAWFNVSSDFVTPWGPWLIWAQVTSEAQCTPTICQPCDDVYPGDDVSLPIMIDTSPWQQTIDLCDFCPDYDQRVEYPGAAFTGAAPDVVLELAYPPELPEVCFTITISPQCDPGPPPTFFRIRSWIADQYGAFYLGDPSYPSVGMGQIYDFTTTGLGCLPNMVYRLYIDDRNGYCCCPIIVTYTGDMPLPPTPRECVPLSTSDEIFIPYEVLFGPPDTFTVSPPDTVIPCWVTASSDTIYADTPEETIVGATVHFSPTHYIGNYIQGFYHTYPTMTVSDQEGLFFQAKTVDYGPEMGDFNFVPIPGESTHVQFSQIIFYEDLVVNKSRTSEYVHLLSPLGGHDPNFIDSLRVLPETWILPHGGFFVTEIAQDCTKVTERREEASKPCSTTTKTTTVWTPDSNSVTTTTIHDEKEGGSITTIITKTRCPPPDTTSWKTSVIVIHSKPTSVDEESIAAKAESLGASLGYTVKGKKDWKFNESRTIEDCPQHKLGPPSLDEEPARPPGIINLFETQSDIDWAKRLFPLDPEESFTLMTGPEASIGPSATDLCATSTASLRYERWGDSAFAAVFGLHAGQPGTQLEFEPDISGGERVALDVRNAGKYPVSVQILGDAPGAGVFCPGDEIYLRPNESGTLWFWIEDAELEGADLTNMRLFLVAIGSSPGVDSIKVDFDNFGVMGLAGPNPPTDVTILYNASTGNAELRWVDQATNRSYKIYRSTTDPFSGFDLLGTVAPGIGFYADPVGANTKAFYHIQGSCEAP